MSLLWQTLGQWITHPARVAVIDEQRSWRGIDLLVGSLHVASTIERTTDARVIGLMLPTSGLFPMSLMASWMLGKTVVPINYLLKPDDLQHVCDDSGIDTIITVQPMLDFLKEIPHGPRMLRLEDINFRSVPTLRWPRWNRADDLGLLLYTSGTSGRPKGVMLTHGNLAANVDQCERWVEFGYEDSMLGVLPQFHVFGLVVLTLLPMSVGMRVHYLARFVPRKIVQWIRRYQPSIFIAIPSMYNGLLTVKDAKPEDFKSLRYIVSGGEPLPDRVVTEFRERFGLVINEGYGLTETSAATHWCRPHEHRAKSVGRALPDIDVRIVSTDDERELGMNEDGEIRMRGPNIMRGYYNLDDESRATFDDNGYFRTGDIGRVDPEGFLYITGRLKEMMIIGGENVFPRDIEEVLNQHSSVFESAVIGVQDPARGEVPIAFVELREGEEFDAGSIRAHCRSILPQYKVPREIHHIESLPRNPTGKVLRRMLQDPNQNQREVVG